MTTATPLKAGDRDTSFMEGSEPAGPAIDPVAAERRRAERLRLLVQPAVAILLAGAVLIWALGIHKLTATEKATVNASSIWNLTLQHLAITFVVAAVVLAIAVPLGIVLTRPRLTWLSPFFVGIANIGAAAPAIGLLVLYDLATHAGFWTGVLPIAFYSLLPVLRNTILGFQEVDATLVDAGRGQGMSGATVLRRIEFPLAVPYILAGLRTSLVLAVGTATLSFLVGAGGLGVLIDTGYKLNLGVALVLGAVLAVALALLVDWLGALAEQFLGPKGLR